MRKNRLDIEDRIERTTDSIRLKGKLSEKAKRQLQTLEKYFKIDYEKRIVTIPVHYEKVSDIIDVNYSNKNHPFVQQEFLASISDKLHSIPIEFILDVDIKIDDYEGYNEKSVIESIQDAFELFHYDVIKERTKANLKVAILVILGVTILAWLFYLCSKKIIGQSGDPTHDTIHELIYTIGAVVLWEAVYIIFLPEDNYKDISYTLLWRINNIRLLNNNDKVVAFTNNINMVNGWIIETKKERRARYFLLLSGTTLICLSLIKIRDIVELVLLNPTKWVTYLILPFSILMVIFGVLAGIGASSYYRDKGPFKRFVLFFGVIASILYLLETITYIVMFSIYGKFEVKPIVAACAYAIVMILYTSCAFTLRNKKKKKN